MLSLPLLLAPLAASASLPAQEILSHDGAGPEARPDAEPPRPPSSPQAAGQASSDEHAFITVRELMRLESEQALAIARQRRKQTGAALPTSAQGQADVAGSGATQALRLVGIYGVGKRLFAEVRSGSQAWLFLNGHSLPVGHTAGAGLYRLKEVAGACVHLEQQGSETILCLPRAGRQ